MRSKIQKHGGFRAAAVVTMLGLVLFMAISMSGCDVLGDVAGDLVDEIDGLAEELEHTTYFNNYTSEDKDGEYIMKGQIHYAAEDDADACAVTVHAKQDTEIHVTGTFEKKKKREGALALVYIDGAGGSMVLADEDTGEIDLTIKVKQGDGQFRFEGENAVYNFELHFSKAEGVTYDWDHMDDFMDELEDMEDVEDLEDLKDLMEDAD